MNLRNLILLCLLCITAQGAYSQADKSSPANPNTSSNAMKQVLIIGMDPKTMDFSKPGFAPGLTAESVLQGIMAEKDKLTKAGYTTDLLFLNPEAIDLDAISGKLKSARWDGVLVGYGIRVSPVNFSLFEKLVNRIHQDVPAAKIIFNNDSKANDLLESVQRWL